jgi:hypothetical protein
MIRVDRIATRRRRQGAWLSTCAMATALAVAPHAASAQAFQGTPSVVTGSATITTGTGSTVIGVGANQTVINWAPTDVSGTGTIDFLPAGTTATFDSGGLGNYTVLNRILPASATGAPSARMVGLSGTVNALVPYCPVSCSFISHVPGGNVWFYTPTGFVIGPTATITVGGLILTTDDIQFTPNPPGAFGSIYGPGGVIQFRGPTGSSGLIDVQAGAQLNGSDFVNGNSYVAMVAPRIQQGGTVSAERSVGYIAAEQADLTINAGLFNISILAGTTDSNGIVHTGTTTGSQSTGAADVKQISFVALPKTTALTMLLSGSVGYTPALSATNDGSSVVLSSGYDTPAPSSIPSAPTGDISIGNTVFNNPLHGFATGKITIQPSSGNTQFLGDASLLALDSIVLTVDTGAQITAPNMFLSAGRPGAGGNIAFVATGKSAIDVNGTLDLDATTEAQDFLSGSTGNGIGGNIILDAAGGTISAGYLSGEATGDGAYDTPLGGNGQGGTIGLVAGLGGTITAPTLILDADGLGGGSDTTGGNGIGGTIGISETGGALNFGAVSLSVEARGGGLTAGCACAIGSGNATGGQVALKISSQAQSWNSLAIFANAFGGFANPGEPVAGSATGNADAIDLQISGPGSLSIAGDVSLTANAEMDAGGPAGYSGHAGGINILAGSAFSVAGTLKAYANAEFADVTDGSPLNSASMHGGAVSVTADGGAITASGFDIQANATGNYASGGPGSAGSATGGDASVVARNGGSIKIDDGTGKALLSMSASALGSSGAAAANALGGTAQLNAVGGSISVLGDARVVADGLPDVGVFGIQTGQGAAATGGTASIQVGGPTGLGGSLTANSMNVEADGDAGSELRGGPVVFGDGGLGKGGNASLTVDGGTLTVGNLNVTARGDGGVSQMSGGPAAFRSGNGTGGTARVAIGGGTSTITGLTIAADGSGGSNSRASGSSELGPLAGDGTGGFALLRMGNGALSANALTIEAFGLGGGGTGSDVSGPATNGGNGTGGTAALFYDAGATGSLTSVDALIVAGGQGGAGGSSPGGTDGNGGNGIGGAAAAEFADGAFNLTSLTLGADGDGGTGAIGGNGSGGTAAFSLVDTTGASGARSLGALSLYANGAGATGSTGPNNAGSAALTVDTAGSGSGITIGGDLTAQAIGDTSPAGNGFTADISGAPLTVNGNVSITTTRDSVMTGTQPIHATGNLTIGTRQLTASGPLIAGGNVLIDGLNGIALGALTSGGTTKLMASNGAITAADLRSAGLVTATGQSLLLESGAGLTFASATATAGDLQIVTTDGLTANGPVSATGNVKLVGNGGLSAGAVTSGGTTTLRAANGAVTITDLLSPGLVSASGRSVDINSTGALTFSDAGTNAGDLVLRALDLTATGPLFASGNASLTGTNGIALGALSSGGTVDLTANNGGISATDLRTPGIVTANGRSIDIASGGGLTFASAAATAGDLGISTALGLTATGPLSATGNVALSGGHGISAGTVTSGGTTSLTAANGVIGITDLTSQGAVSASGESVNVAATGPLTFANATATGGDLTLTALDLTATGPLSATGNVALDAANGIAVGSLTSGGATGLTSDGAISVSNLNAAGLVSAVGSSLDLTSNGKLSFDTAKATGGNLAIATAGDLAISNGSATGSVNLSSSGGAISSAGSITSGGNFDAVGATGLNFAALTSGGTTGLRAPNGALSVSNLQSAGLVTASGRSVLIGSSGGLHFTSLTATAGDLGVSAALALRFDGNVSATGNVALTGTTGLSAGSVKSGGTASLTASNGAITVAGLDAPGLVSASGRSINIDSPGALAFAGANATAGDLTLSATNVTASGPMSASGNVSITGLNGIAVGSLTSGGTTQLASVGAVSATDLRSAGKVTASGTSIDIASGAGLAFDDIQTTGGPLRISTAGDLALNGVKAAGALTLASSNGAITATGDASAGGNASVTAAHGITLPSLVSGGTTLLQSGDGALSVGGLKSPGAVTAKGASIKIVSPEGLTFAAADAAGALSITAGGALVLPSTSAGGKITLATTAGGVTVNGNLSGLDTAIVSPGSVSIGGDLTANGTLLINAGGGFASTGTVRSGATTIAGRTGISLATLNSTDAVTLQSSNGDVTVQDIITPGSVTASGTNVTLSSSGGLRLAGVTATAGDIHLAAAGDLLSGGNLSATGLLSIEATGLFSLSGSGTGTTISVRSGDIDIGGESRLGARGTTQDISLSTYGAAAPLLIGGSSQGSGYTLDNLEAGRLYADRSITIGSLGSGTLPGSGDITLGALALSYGDGGNLGTGGLLSLQTGGKVTVNGAVQLATSSNDDTFSIDPTLIDVVSGQGSIVMQSDPGKPLGTLSLTADRIVVATPATLDAVNGLTDLGQISKKLDAPAPPGPAGGYLQAGTIRLSANNSFLVQNGGASSAFADRRGFTANALDITTGSASTQIAINGVILQSGDPVTGLATIPLVTINGKAAAAGGQFDRLSTINGCVIGNDCSAPQLPPVTNPTDNDLTSPLDHPTGQVFNSELFSLAANAPLITPPLVDEPITGVGNDDLWISGCSDNADDKRCSDKKGGD